MDQEAVELSRQILASLPSLGQRIQLGSIRLSFAAPKSGWLKFGLAAGRQSVAWSISYAFDPFERYGPIDEPFDIEFVAWLEKIATGADATLLIGLEGPTGFLIANGHGTSEVWLVAGQTPPLAFPFNVIIDRSSLVRSFYAQLVEFWEGPELTGNWQEWALDPDRASPPSLRSDVLDALVTHRI